MSLSMKRMFFSSFAAIAGFGLSFVSVAISPMPAEARDLTVVELFTSQGCSSCPPADDFLAELAERDDVLALSAHVDYWDYLGWEDPFASSETTARQHYYAEKLDLRFVYTPQMVIQGTTQAVGSHREEVLRRIREISHADDIGVEVKRTTGQAGGEEITISVAAKPTPIPADIWLVILDEARATRVERGENRGRYLAYRNVVRDMERIAAWNGGPLVLSIPLAELAEGDACAVLVQDQSTARVLGAAHVALR